MKKNDIILPADYSDWLLSLKQRIAGARQHALLSANHEKIRLYHDIGREIVERQNNNGWGSKVIAQIANRLVPQFLCERRRPLAGGGNSTGLNLLY
jgi:hypothetical protein